MAKTRDGSYLRISDDAEGLELGVARQRADISALSERTGGVVVDEYSDNDISASTRSRKIRPEYNRLLADARAGRINRIVAYTSSRLTRRPRELEDLIDLAERHGVTYLYLRSPSFDLNTADGRQVARILAATDAAEAERTGERVARKKQEQREAGLYVGGPRPYGYEQDGMTVREAELREVREWADRVLAGESLSAIVKDLNTRGVPTAGRAARWSRVVLRQTLMRPRNASLQGSPHDPGAAVLAANWEPLIDDDRAVAVEKWRAVVAVLTDPARRTSPGNQPRWLGSRLYLCGVCQRPSLVVSGSARRYQCRPSNDSPSQHLARTARPLDEYVETVLVSYLVSKQGTGLFARPTPDVDVQGLHNLSVVLRSRRKTQAQMHAAGAITDEEFAEGSLYFRTRLEEIAAELGSAEGVNPLAPLAAVEDIGRAWFGTKPDRSDGYSLERRRAILRHVAQVTVNPALRGRTPFDPAYVTIKFLSPTMGRSTRPV